MVSDKVFTTDGTSTIYSADFKILSDNHCNVYIDTVLQSRSTYDIINNAAVFATAPTSGSTLTLQVGTTPDDLLVTPTEAGIVAGNITNVNTVAGISGNVTTVAGISADVTAVVADATDIGTVSTSIADVNTVAGIDADVSTVAGISANVTAVAADATDIGVVAGKATQIGLLGTTDAISDMNTLGTADVVLDMNTLGTAGNVTNMDTLAGISGNVTTVAGISGNTTTVAGISANVTTVAGISTNVTSVADNTTNINSVAGNATNINAVNANSTNINAVNTNSTNINTVATNNTDISTVATNIAKVTTVADDMVKVIAVADDLAEAISEIETAADDLNEATSEIDTVANAITNVNLVGDDIANVNEVADNIGSVNAFGEQYRVSATEPTTSLDAGDLWFDTVANTMKVYTGSGFANAGSSVNGIDNSVEHIATLGQTSFTATYDAGYLNVFLNGVKLDASDYTATDGANVVLDVATALNDSVFIQAFGTFTLADHYSKTASDATYAALTGADFTGDITAPTFNGVELVHTDTHNLGLGTDATSSITTGSWNTGVGGLALNNTTTGDRNTAIGKYALRVNVAGSYNTALGADALSVTTSNNNTGVGYDALEQNTTGTENIALGAFAGDAITTGSNNTIIGHYAGTTALADTVVIAAGTTERLKVTSTGLQINGAGNVITGLGIDDNATSTAITIDANENVMVGTGTPESDIHSVFNGVQLGIGGGLFGVTSTSVTELACNSKPTANDANVRIGVAGDTDFAIYTNNAVSLTVKADGRGLSQFTAKAWVQFNGTGTPSVTDSHNVGSITDIGTGQYVANFTNSIGANMAAVGATGESNSAGVVRIGGTSSTGIFCTTIVSHHGGIYDDSKVYLIAFGD